MSRQDLLKSKYFRDKQVSKLNRIEDEIVKRVKKISFLDSKFDTSNEKLYSMTEEEIRTKFENWRRRLKQSNIRSSDILNYKKFNEEINTIHKSMKKYVKNVINEREQVFLNSLKENGESIAKYKRILDKMTDKEKQQFFSSDSYMFPNDWYYSSRQFREFAEISHSSLIYAKLEDWAINHTKIFDKDTKSVFEKYQDTIRSIDEKQEKRNKRQIEYAKKNHSIYTERQLKSLESKKQKQIDMLLEDEDD